jgi:hypothetical protein
MTKITYIGGADHVITGNLQFNGGGSIRFEDTNLVFYDGYSDGYTLSEIASRDFITTRGSIQMIIDPTNGQSPPSGTVVTVQPEYNALGYDLKYLQDAFDILPYFVEHNIRIMMKSGTHLAKPNSGRWWSGVFEGFVYVPPIRASVKKAYFDYNPEPPASFYAGIDIYGEGETEIESSQSGTIYYNEHRITRDSGTWTVDEHKGRFVEILTGVTAGEKYIIVGNSTTELEIGDLCRESTGAVTFKIIENDTTCLSSLNGATGIQVGMIAEGDVSEVPISFKNLNFGNSTVNFGSMVIGTHSIAFDRCNILSSGYIYVGSSRGKPKSYLETIDSVIEFTAESLGIYVERGGHLWENASYIRGKAEDSINGALIHAELGGVLDLNSTVIEPDNSYTRSCIRIYGGGVRVDHKMRIYGNGSCTGIWMRDTTHPCSFEDLQGVITDCAIAVHLYSVGRININTNFYDGSTGNTIGWKLENGSQLVINNPQEIEATTDLDIDGDTGSYSLLSNIGDMVIGQYGSSILRRS